MHNNVLLSYRLLYYTYGLLPIVVGIDKFFGLIAYWVMYLNPIIPLYLQMTPEVFLYIFGVLEILVGLLILWKPNIGGYVVATVLLLVSINLFTIHDAYEGTTLVRTYYDIAFRDIAMAVGAIVLSLLSQQLQGNEHPKHMMREHI